jgi:hypothetical protein
MQHLSQHDGPRRAGSLALVVLLLIVGSVLGIIAFANQESLLGVVFAALVPGFAVGWVLEPAQVDRVRERDESH